MDGAHHVPAARDLHVARMLLHREPPPGDRHARDHDPAVAILLRTLLHADVHQLQLLAVRLEPEVDGVLLLGIVLVVEDGVGEPAPTFHAAHDLDLLVDEVEIGVELRIAEHEGAIARALADHLLRRGNHVVLGEVALGRGVGGRRKTREKRCRAPLPQCTKPRQGPWLLQSIATSARDEPPSLARGSLPAFGRRPPERPAAADFAVASTLIACAASICLLSSATSAAVLP